jgi:hypothetical protein
MEYLSIIYKLVEMSYDIFSGMMRRFILFRYVIQFKFLFIAFLQALKVILVKQNITNMLWNFRKFIFQCSGLVFFSNFKEIHFLMIA